MRKGVASCSSSCRGGRISDRRCPVSGQPASNSLAGGDWHDVCSEGFVDHLQGHGKVDKKSLRTYRTLGISDLSQSADPAAWREVTPGNESAYKFFKVEVDLK